MSDIDIVKAASDSFRHQHDDLLERAERAAIGRAIFDALAEHLAALPSFGHVKDIGVSVPYYVGAGEPGATIYLYLRPEHQDTPLLREIAQTWHVRVVKTLAYAGESLDAETVVNGLRVIVCGYKPATCRVVESTELVEVKDAQVVDGRTYVSKVVSKVICAPPEGDDEGAA